MPTTLKNGAKAETKREEMVEERQHERWAHWPVNWSSIAVGALASIAAVLLFGLIGIALGAHLLGPEHRIVDVKKMAFGTLAFSVFSSFLAFVIGGWVAGKIAGILHAEPAMLYGAIVWLVAIPLLVLVAGLGGANLLGGWYAGLAGNPAGATAAVLPFDRPEPLSATATEAERTQYKADLAEYQRNVKQWKEDTPKVVRNTALGVLTALFLGLMGSVLGGWMASGEPMSLTYDRTRHGIRSSQQHA